MKLRWASSICDAVGKPMTHILRTRVTKTCQQALTGWQSARNFSEAFQLAADCAQAICQIALNAHGLTGEYTIQYDESGPTQLEILLSPFPHLSRCGGSYAPHRIIITSELGGDGRRRMFVRHVHPTLGAVSQQPLTLKQLEIHIYQIHALTKSIARELKREHDKRLPATDPG